MKNSKYILTRIAFIFLILVCFEGCAPSNEQFLSRFDTFVNDVYVEKDQMTQDDWTSVVSKYDKYMDKYSSHYSSKFTPEENREFGRIQARYMKILLEEYMEMSADYFEVGSQILDGYLDEMGNDIDELGIDDYVNSIYEDVEQMDIDGFVNQIEDQIEDMEFDF